MRHPRLDLRAMLACCRHEDRLDRLATVPCRREETLGAKKRTEIKALWPERHRGAWDAFREHPKDRARRRQERACLRLSP